MVGVNGGAGVGLGVTIGVERIERDELTLGSVYKGASVSGSNV